MSILAPPNNPNTTNNFASAPQFLTWDEYLNEDEVNLRYDIVEGVRRFMSSPGWNHQEIALNLGELFRAYQRRTGRGRTIIAALDVLIRRSPKLQVRQPDVLFITNAVLNAAGGPPTRGPLTVAPEIVIEILSDSDRRQVLNDKLADYMSIGVREVWLVRPDDQTVEVVTLSVGSITRAGFYGISDVAQSTLFADLQIAVADILRV